MTQEQKAKAYDEALNKAKIEINTKGIGETVNLCYQLFPQLAENEDEDESEDERIRKFLIQHAAVSDVARHFYEIGKKQKEQKPHTDEEKEYIRTIKSIISDFIRDKKPENLAYYQRIYDWLDGRHVPFSCSHENDKPAEWNAEDKEMLEYVIGDVNDAKQLFTTKEAIDLCDEEIAWLKSLRPSWKPSEEQMEALKRASVNEYIPAKQFDILVSLYKQLKKLM